MKIIDMLSLQGETYLRTQLTSPFEDNTTQLEAVGAVRIRPIPELAITVGGGGGTPIVQGFAPPEGADLKLIERLFLGNRMTEPEEVAEAIAYLASPAAASINGVAIPMDSGVYAG